ncbi:hypothetical protein [Methylobacterium sp. JK268]
MILLDLIRTARPSAAPACRSSEQPRAAPNDRRVPLFLDPHGGLRACRLTQAESVLDRRRQAVRLGRRCRTAAPAVWRVA